MTSTLPWAASAATRIGNATVTPAGWFFGAAGPSSNPCSTDTTPPKGQEEAVKPKARKPILHPAPGKQARLFSALVHVAGCRMDDVPPRIPHDTHQVGLRTSLHDNG